MKPVHDPNRQQPTVPVRPPGPNVARTTPATPTTSQPTNVTSHIVSTGNPIMASIKTIPVTTARVVPHTTTTTLTLVGAGTAAGSLRPVSPATGIATSFHVSKGQTTITNVSAGPRGALASPMMRNIVTAPIITSPTASVTPASFVPGIRALTRPALTTVSASGTSPWPTSVGPKGTSVTVPTKITPAMPGTMTPRAATTSLTVTTRPVVAAPTITSPARPEIATLRTTKPVGTPDKFIRTPARTTLAFATATSGQSSGQFTSSTPLTHLAVAPLPTNQSTSGAGTAVTLQPIVVSTNTSSSGGPAKITSTTPGRQTGLHPIGPKVITQPAHGHIITHLAGVGVKPGAQVTGTVRGSAGQTAGGTTFATTPGGAQVKVLAQAPGALLTDVLQQGATTTLIPSGGVYIQTTPHTALNVTPLDRGTVTSASYTLPANYFYDATSGGGSLIATSTTHAAHPHPLIRNIAPSIGQGAVATMQVQTAGTFHQADDPTRKTFSSNLTAHAVGGSLVGARFNPVMVMDTGRSLATTTATSTIATIHSEGSSEQIAQQTQMPTVPISCSSQTLQLSQQQHSLSQWTPLSSQPPHTSASTPQSAQPAPSQQQQQQAGSELSSQQAGSSFLSGTTTPTSTPSKLCASPRPSILRKRDHDGTLSKVQKNLGPMLAALAGSLPSSGNSSPPPSPPMRPDSQEDTGKDGNGGHSSAGSSTISATSSPGLPCDGDNNGGSQGSLCIKAEPADPADTADGASNNGTNGNSDIMSPRKKPRKQQLTGNELQEPPYSDENAEFAEDKVKSEANHKAGQDVSAQGAPSRGTPATRRPSVSLLQAYRSCWKPRNNHFVRPTDVRPREERRPTVAELSSQKRVVQKARGWKLHHLSTQMEDMGEREADVLDQLSQVLNEMETPRPGFEPSSKDMNRTHELIRSNMQRSKVVRDQLEECRIQLIRLLDHTSPVVDIIKRNANRRQAKKKY